MSFLDSYKRLEKLCGDIYGNPHGLSAYIDEMQSKIDGSYLVPGWNEDLKKLKHYRRVRNIITHEPGYTEENMCEPDDALWLEHFYSRIMSTDDPLAIYGKERGRRAPETTSRTESPAQTDYTPSQSKTAPSKSAGCLTVIIAALIIAAALIAYII